MACGTKKKLCIGQLDKLIEIQSRHIKAPLNTTPTDVDADELFTNRVHVWANIKTSVGEAIYDGVNIEQALTHIFTFAYLGFEVTSADWVIFNSKRYKILSADNINEDNIYVSLRCVERGVDTKEATKA